MKHSWQIYGVAFILLIGTVPCFSRDLGRDRGNFILTIKEDTVTTKTLRRVSMSPGRLVRVAALLSQGFSENSFQGTGWRLVSRVNNVATIEGPFHAARLLKNIPGILMVERWNKVVPCMDSARRETRIDEVQGTAPTSLKSSFTGKGVLFGIMDNEFDTHQPAFLDSLGHTRFVALWDQTAKYSLSRKNKYGYGAIETGGEIDKDTLFGSDSTQYHGTHMASCGAGSDRKHPYYGAAPDAQIIAVKYGNGSADLINGLAWLLSIADSLHKPCVVNMSIGIAAGPHDGTSLMDQTIDNLDSIGHIIVGAAGNDGNVREHTAFVLNARESKGTWIEPEVQQVSPTQTAGICYFDVWGESGKAITDTVYLLDRRDMSYKKSGNAVTTNASRDIIDTVLWPDPLTGPDSLIIEAIAERANAANAKPHIELYMNSSNSNVIMGAKLYSTAATTINGWNAAKKNCLSYGIAGFIDGDSSMTINEVGGTAKRIIAVGGYVSKVSPLRYDGTAFSTGDTGLYHYLEYTSLGPTVDGRIKPDISAPGREVTGAMTRYIVDRGGRTALWPDTQSMMGRYAFLGGTSISSPIVAGIIACMLEYNKTLTSDQVKTALQQSAIKDDFTGRLSSPDVRWGAGKVNAEGAMAALGVATSAQRRLNRVSQSAPSVLFTKKNMLTITSSLLKKGAPLQSALFTVSGGCVFSSVVQNGRPAALPCPAPRGCYIVRFRSASGVSGEKRLLLLP